MTYDKKGNFQWQKQIKQTIKKKKKGRKLYNVVLCNRQVVDPNPKEKWKRKEESLLLAVKTSSKQTTGKHTFREFGKLPAKSTRL